MIAFLFQTGTLASITRLRSVSSVSNILPRRYRTTPVACHLSTAVPSSFPSSTEASERLDGLLDAGLGVVVLKRGKATLFRNSRNPMVFAGSIERHIPSRQQQSKDCAPVAVCNGSFTCLGFGFYNMHSMFRVRILHHCGDGGGLALPWDFQRDIVRKCEHAVSLRSAIGIPNAETNVYRVVNGEGDRLSGLVVDRSGDTLIVSSSALWCERYKSYILKALADVLPNCEDVVWRRNLDRLKQDGLHEEVSQLPESHSESDTSNPLEELGVESETINVQGRDVVVKECGVQYVLSRFALTRGQKTGHYADQRENRLFVRELVRLRSTPSKVLDLFCYTGGFALNAALGKEGTTVVAVDSSEKALSMGRKNAELNGVSSNIQFIRTDVVKYLRSTTDTQRESFDIVVVDPPKFAPNVKAMSRAVHKYRSLNQAALHMVKRGGILCTCSCSVVMTQNRAAFIETMRRAGREAGKELTLLKTLGAASDHPITPEMPETEYLTMCVFVCR